MLVVERSPSELLDVLTPREKEVADQLYEGLTSKEIGLVLGISPRTVEVYRSRVLQKLGCQNVVQFVRLWFSVKPR